MSGYGAFGKKVMPMVRGLHARLPAGMIVPPDHDKRAEGDVRTYGKTAHCPIRWKPPKESNPAPRRICKPIDSLT